MKKYTLQRIIKEIEKLREGDYVGKNRYRYGSMEALEYIEAVSDILKIIKKYKEKE